MTPTAVARMSEQDLLDNTIELAHLFGWHVAHFRPAMTKHGWRTPVSADGAGFPDCVLVRDRLIAAEIKSQRGVTSDAQKDWLATLSNATVEVYVWRPSDWLDGTIQKVLQHLTTNEGKAE